MSLLCQYDQWSGYHGSLDARRHRKDQVRLKAFDELFFCGPAESDHLLLFLGRIQNMKMIDGKPEYKNGLVSRQFYLFLLVFVITFWSLKSFFFLSMKVK